MASAADAQQFGTLRQTPLVTPVAAIVGNGIVRDIDGDGAPDVLLRWGSALIAAGDLRFTYSPPGDRIPLLVPIPFATNFHEARDVDGDGDLDLIRLATTFSPSLQTRIEVMPGSSNGYFGSPVVKGSFPGVGSLLRADDVDGDGRDDLLVRSGLALGLLRNVTGTFVDVTATNLPAGLGGGVLAVGDVDGDADRDFVVVSSGAVQLLLNNGAGVFTIAANGGLPALPAVEGMSFGDADGDGDRDLLIAVSRGAPLQLWTNNGAGVFVQSTGVLPLHGRSTSFVDLDADGDADILSITASGLLPTIRVWRNVGGAFVPQPETLIDDDQELGAPELADLDNDGDLDVVLGGSLFFVDEGTQRYAPLQRNAATRTPDASTVVVGDIDGDGVMDLVSGGSVHAGHGDGYFTLTQQMLPPGGVGRALLDADADGDLDLVWTTADPSAPQVGGVMSNQGGVLTALPSLPIGQLVGEVVVADFNGDGRNDLFSRSGVLLQNLGGGAFAPVGTTIPGQGPSAAGDFNGDGRIDLVVGAANGWVQWRNLGGFLFQRVGLPVPAPPACLAAGDLDGDGDVDLVCGYSSSSFGGTFGFLQVWKNNGLGVFVLDAAHVEGNTGSLAVALADVDEDGAVDMIGKRVWINDGTGTFFDRSSGVQSDGALAVADVDNDGDPDLAYALGQRVVVYGNRHRHLGAPRVPVLGHPFDIQMAARPGYGTPGAFVVDAVGFARIAPVLLPGLGLLHIDPTLAVFSAPAATGIDGTHTFTIQLPTSPALAGIDAFWQGLVIDNGQARLTNFTAQRLVP